jgi:phosphomannomutase
VDTEAIREEDIIVAKKWSANYKFDSIVSTDGDSDRPLLSDEMGNWIRGDISGILCARYLQADSVSTTISCNSAIEKCGWFRNIKRTKIGSPYVIASMIDELKKGHKNIVGYEANGGFLTGSKIIKEGRVLTPLPTRDAVISSLSILMLSIVDKKPISQIVESLPKRFTASERLKDFPIEKSNQLLARFSDKNEEINKEAILKFFGNTLGKVSKIDRTDGIRIYFENDEIIHLRPSGNAPEFRCYNEANDEKRVKELNQYCLEKLKRNIE